MEYAVKQAALATAQQELASIDASNTEQTALAAAKVAAATDAVAVLQAQMQLASDALAAASASTTPAPVHSKKKGIVTGLVVVACLLLLMIGGACIGKKSGSFLLAPANSMDVLLLWD